MQNVSEEHRRLVVEVVTCDERVVAAFECDAIEDVSFGHATGRARRPFCGSAAVRHVVAVLFDDVDHGEGETALVREGACELTGRIAVVVNSQADVQAVNVVAEVVQDVPHRKAVLAAADGNQQLVGRFAHVELADGLLDLLMADTHEVLGTEVRVVSLQVDDRRAPAHTALHGAEPPEITLRISTAASS